MNNTFATRKTSTQDKHTPAQINYPVDTRPSFASVVIWIAFGLIAFSALIAVFIFVVPGA